MWAKKARAEARATGSGEGDDDSLVMGNEIAFNRQVERLPDADVVFDVFYTLDVARDRFSLFGLPGILGESAQLHGAFECFHADVHGTDFLVGYKGGFDPSGYRGVVEVLTGTFLGGRAGATGKTCECDSNQCPTFYVFCVHLHAPVFG